MAWRIAAGREGHEVTILTRSGSIGEVLCPISDLSAAHLLRLPNFLRFARDFEDLLSHWKCDAGQPVASSNLVPSALALSCI